MVPAVGNPDLSGPGGSEPRRGLVIFPAGAASRSGLGPDSRQGDWRLVLGALALAAVIVVAVLALTGGSSGPSKALPAPAPSLTGSPGRPPPP